MCQFLTKQKSFTLNTKKMSEKVQGPTKSDVLSWIEKDLSTAVAYLNMVRTDKLMLDALADVALERLKAQEEAKAAQPELPIENG